MSLYQTPIQKQKQQESYPFKRKSTEAKVLLHFAYVLEHVVNHENTKEKIEEMADE